MQDVVVSSKSHHKTISIINIQSRPLESREMSNVQIQESQLDDWKFLVGYWKFDSQVTAPHYLGNPSASPNQ